MEAAYQQLEQLEEHRKKNQHIDNWMREVLMPLNSYSISKTLRLILYTCHKWMYPYVNKYIPRSITYARSDIPYKWDKKAILNENYLIHLKAWYPNYTEHIEIVYLFLSAAEKYQKFKELLYSTYHEWADIHIRNDIEHWLSALYFHQELTFIRAWIGSSISTILFPVKNIELIRSKMDHIWVCMYVLLCDMGPDPFIELLYDATFSCTRGPYDMLNHENVMFITEVPSDEYSNTIVNNNIVPLLKRQINNINRHIDDRIISRYRYSLYCNDQVLYSVYYTHALNRLLKTI